MESDLLNDDNLGLLFSWPQLIKKKLNLLKKKEDQTLKITQFMWDISIIYGHDIASVVIRKSIYSHEQLAQHDVLATYSRVLHGLDLVSNSHSIRRGIHFDVKRKYKPRSCITIKKRRNSI